MSSFNVGEKIPMEEWEFTVLDSQPPACLLKKSKKGETGSVIIGFEVVLLKKVEAKVAHFGQFKEGWSMPTDEEWGEKGWSYNNYSDALLRFRALSFLSRRAATQPFRTLKKRHAKRLLHDENDKDSR